MMRIRSSDKWQELEKVFSMAVDLPAGRRTAYLDDTCSTDPELRAEVERLLHANDQAGDFLGSLDGTRAASLLNAVGAGDEEKFIGRYRVLRELGRGGMGIVYLAEDPSLKRLVAVKLLPPYLHADSTANRRLLEEARAASALDHPNIATVHEIGETDDGQLFITMTYYEGETLRGRIEGRRIAIEDALSIAGQVAAGLAAAHRKQIIHRDIKPENILVTTDGVAKIVDFGIAKVAGQALTQTGVAVGTAAYMSPEQTFGTGVDHRTDLWSLGVVLYEMLAGERPFRGDKQEVILFAIRSDPPQVNPRLSALPAGVVSIIERCLQKDPEMRYSSAEQLAEDLKRVQSGDVALNAARAASRSHAVPGVAAFRSMGRWKQVLVAASILLAAGFVVNRSINGRADASPEPRTAVAPRPASSAEDGSIAVLSFASMSSSPDREYIGDGIADELIHALSRVQHLRVVSRTSSFQFKGMNVDVRDIAAKLGVAAVLDGTVRSHGDSLRVTVHLVDARTGYELWSQAFDRSMKDVFDVQEEIARAVVNKLRITIPDGSRRRLAENLTSDSEAYRLYLKGRQLWNERRELPQAIKYFEQAISRDSSFALAHLGLGQAWINLPFYSSYPLEPAHERARAAILEALSIDSTLADAHGSLGSMAADRWRWKEAQEYFERAIAMNGGDATIRMWYGEMLLKVGRVEDAIREMNVAHRLNPLSAVVTTNFAYGLYTAGRFEEAVALFRSVDELKPNGHAANGLGSTYLAMGRPREAIAQYVRALELYEGRGTRAYLGRAYSLGGRKSEAEAILAELEKGATAGSGSPWGAALVAGSLGKNDKALYWLERAYQIREFPLSYIKVDPGFRSLHSEPRFRQLLTKMGFEK